MKRDQDPLHRTFNRGSWKTEISLRTCKERELFQKQLFLENVAVADGGTFKSLSPLPWSMTRCPRRPNLAPGEQIVLSWQTRGGASAKPVYSSWDYILRVCSQHLGKYIEAQKDACSAFFMLSRVAETLQDSFNPSNSFWVSILHFE